MSEDHVPEGFVGIGTVCSITVNGVLLSREIPTRSRFVAPVSSGPFTCTAESKADRSWLLVTRT